MMMKTSGKWPLFIIIFLVLGYFLMDPSMIGAQVRTHLVVKGDTLWDISEKYYGDPDLWPKLWEMNPFVTNPHLLSPGDIITLLEGVPFKKSFEQEDKKLVGEDGKELAELEDKDLAGQGDKKPDETAGMPLAMLNGINIGNLINVNTLGYLSRKKVRPQGRIFSSDSTKKLLYEGDTAFVLFDSDVEVKPGDQFTIAKSYKLNSLPATGSRRGYAVSFVGQMVIDKPAAINRSTGQPDERKHIYQATITESYRTVNVDDLVIPYEPFSSCIKPTPVDEQYTDAVHAGKDNMKILGEMSVVYFDRGLKQGVRKGNLLELVRTNIVPKPYLGEKSYATTSILPRSKVKLPDSPVGIILIVDARPDTSTGLVISSNEEFYPGASVKAGFAQIETTKYLSMMPSCNKE